MKTYEKIGIAITAIVIEALLFGSFFLLMFIAKELGIFCRYIITNY